MTPLPPPGGILTTTTSVKHCSVKGVVIEDSFPQSRSRYREKKVADMIKVPTVHRNLMPKGVLGKTSLTSTPAHQHLMSYCKFSDKLSKFADRPNRGSATPPTPPMATPLSKLIRKGSSLHILLTDASWSPLRWIPNLDAKYCKCEKPVLILPVPFDRMSYFCSI